MLAEVKLAAIIELCTIAPLPTSTYRRTMPTENELLDQQYGPASTVCEYPLDWPYDKYLQSADAQEYKERAQERLLREQEENSFP